MARRPLTAAALALPLLLLPATSALAGPVAQRVSERGEVRVCIWPQYHGVTFRDPHTGLLRGIDADLSAALGHDLGVKVRYVDSSFLTLMNDIEADRCDVAMFAVAVTPERQTRLRFTRPYLQSGVYAVTTLVSRTVTRWSDIDRPGVRVAVLAGTFMESAMTKALRQAELVLVRPPQTREDELRAGRVDVFMADRLYSSRLAQGADWARLIPPPRDFAVASYAYAVKPGDDAWLARVDAFLSRAKADGRVARAAQRESMSDAVVP